MYQKGISTLKASAVLVTVMLALLQIQGCGGGGGGGSPAPQQVVTSKLAVVSTTPADNSVAVETNSPITITFNETIDPATLNTQTFTLLENGTTAVPGNVTCTGATAQFIPDGVLSAGASYTATVSTGVKNLAGNALAANYNWQFTTASDTTPPTVLTTFPAINSVGVAINSAITVTFNEAIDPATLNTQTFTLMKDATTPVPGNVTFTGATAQFIPAGDLSAGASYTATVSTGVKDLAGNALAASYNWQFTTGVAMDNSAPTVLFTYPASNSGSVAMNTAIAVTFSEPIDPSTFNAQTLILMNDGTTSVAGSVTYFGTSALFRPLGNLSAGSSYTATVTTGVKDLAGNPLAANYSWKFTTSSTSDLQPPIVLSVSPPDSATNMPVNSPLVVTFNEAIMPSDFGLLDGRPVAVSFNDTYTTITMAPTVALKPGTTYNSSIRQKDIAGNPMPTAFTWHFSTSP